MLRLLVRQKYQKSNMVSTYNSPDFNFQYYVNTVKQKKITWNAFANFMQDLSFSDVKRLKYWNEFLLTELTDSYSDLVRLKYLNVLLMTKFKDFIQIKDDVEISENENLEDDVDHDFNFQYYVDRVKQKKIPWSAFVNFMEDLSFFGCEEIKILE